MTMCISLPSEDLRRLGAAPSQHAVRSIAEAWLARPDDLYRLSQDERRSLVKALCDVDLHHIVPQLNQACSAVHERQPEVIEARARATAAVIEALQDPRALYELPTVEWIALIQTARQSNDPRASEKLSDARKRFRDGQPEVIAAFEAVEAALGNSAQILALKLKEWSRLLKTADSIPYDFGSRYCNYRQRLIETKTDALIASRIDATPSSSIKHLGISGQMSLAFVRKIDDVIGKRWLTVPRLGVGKNRKEMVYESGIPQAQISSCDSCWGPFHGIPEGKSNGTTSIICDLKSAALLKMFGHTAFDVNVSPELESYFRSLEPFPWEQEAEA